MKLHEQLVRDRRDILESNLTQDEMAEKLGVSRPTIRLALELIGIVNSSSVGDFLPLADENYPPLTKDRKSVGQRLFVPGASHITSFWKFVQKTEPCWVSNKRSMKIGGASFQMGRVSYGIHFGKDSGGLNVARSCNNKDCVNPDHLVLSSEKNSHRAYSNVGMIQKFLN